MNPSAPRRPQNNLRCGQREQRIDAIGRRPTAGESSRVTDPSTGRMNVSPRAAVLALAALAAAVRLPPRRGAAAAGSAPRARDQRRAARRRRRRLAHRQRPGADRGQLLVPHRRPHDRPQRQRRRHGQAGAGARAARSLERGREPRVGAGAARFRARAGRGAAEQLQPAEGAARAALHLAGRVRRDRGEPAERRVRGEVRPGAGRPRAEPASATRGSSRTRAAR